MPEREGEKLTVAWARSSDSGTSAGSSIDSFDTDSVYTDSFDSASSSILQCNFDLRKKTSALRFRGKVLRRSDLQQVRKRQLTQCSRQ